MDPEVLMAGSRLTNYTAANMSFFSWKRTDNSESRIKSPRGKVKSHGESFPGRSRIEP